MGVLKTGNRQKGVGKVGFGDMVLGRESRGQRGTQRWRGALCYPVAASPGASHGREPGGTGVSRAGMHYSHQILKHRPTAPNPKSLGPEMLHNSESGFRDTLQCRQHISSLIAVMKQHV